MFLLIALSILILGCIGIMLLSVILIIKYKRKFKDFITIYLLIAIWFWGWGLGFIRGIFKPVEKKIVG